MNFEYIDNLDNILNYLAEKVISKDITEDQAAEIYSEACNDALKELATYISESTIDEDVKKDLLSVFEAEDTEDDTEQKESIKDKIKAKAASAKRIIKKAAPVAVAAGAIGTAAYLNSDRHKTNVAKRKLGYDTAKDRQEHYVDYRERKYQDKLADVEKAVDKMNSNKGLKKILKVGSGDVKKAQKEADASKKKFEKSKKVLDKYYTK